VPATSTARWRRRLHHLDRPIALAATPPSARLHRHLHGQYQPGGAERQTLVINTPAPPRSTPDHGRVGGSGSVWSPRPEHRHREPPAANSYSGSTVVLAGTLSLNGNAPWPRPTSRSTPISAAPNPNTRPGCCFAHNTNTLNGNACRTMPRSRSRRRHDLPGPQRRRRHHRDGRTST